MLNGEFWLILCLFFWGGGGEEGEKTCVRKYDNTHA